MTPEPYKTFFTSVLPLEKNVRAKVFLFACIPIRVVTGILFYVFRFELLFSVLSLTWGTFWTLIMIKQRRWIDKQNTPRWWRGLFNLSFRTLFNLVLVFFGFVGIIDKGIRDDMNLVVAFTVWIDVIRAVIANKMTSSIG